MKSVNCLLVSCVAALAPVQGFQPTTALSLSAAVKRTRASPPKTLFVSNSNSNDDWDTSSSSSTVDWDIDYSPRTQYDYDYDDYEPLQENRQLIETTNSILQTSHRSFKNVERMANYLLQENPMMAVGIFVSAGVLAAYAMGFFLMEGDVESLNPAANGAIPYWDEEILVMTRKIH